VRERPDFVECRAESVPCDLDVVTVLEVQPEALAGPEVPREPQGGVGGDAPFAVDDLVDSARGNADRYRQAMLSDLERLYCRYSSISTSPGCMGGMIESVLMTGSLLVVFQW
jgi:hypothetical protein